MDGVQDFLHDAGLVVLYTVVSSIVALVVFELLNRRYHFYDEIFKENSVAAGVLASSFVLGIFYMVTQIVIN